MKKFLFILVLFSIIVPRAFADDIGLGDYTSGVENAWNGQKQFTDEDFEKTVKKLEEKKNRNKIKKIKGKSLQYNNKYDSPPSEPSEMLKDNILLSLPVNLITIDNQEIPVGHYNVFGKKVKGKVYLEFKQAYSTVATVEAVETNNDFEQSTINFVKILPYDENHVKLIFGSMDFNAYTFIPIENGISAQ